MIYNFIIKTLDNTPDLFDEVEADDFDTAVDHFAGRYQIKDFRGREFIERCVIAENQFIQ